jgi:hypothetical protein
MVKKCPGLCGIPQSSTQRGIFVKETGMKCGDYSAGIGAALGGGRFMSSLPCLGDSQVAFFFFLLDTLACFDLLRDAE